MRSLLFTIPSLNDSSYLTSQQGKISTGTFLLYNVQQIDQYGGLQTVKTVSCSAASAMACYKLVISFDLREPVWFFSISYSTLLRFYLLRASAIRRSLPLIY